MERLLQSSSVGPLGMFLAGVCIAAKVSPALARPGLRWRPVLRRVRDGQRRWLRGFRMCWTQILLVVIVLALLLGGRERRRVYSAVLRSQEGNQRVMAEMGASLVQTRAELQVTRRQMEVAQAKVAELRDALRDEQLKRRELELRAKWEPRLNHLMATDEP